jgi:hypothetical protein
MFTVTRRFLSLKLLTLALLSQACLPVAALASSLDTLTVPSLNWVKLTEVTRSTLGRATYLKNDPSSLEQTISGVSTLELENNVAAQAIICDYSTGTQSCTQNSVTAGQFARSVQKLPSNVPFVLGRYAPLNAVLVIDIYKVARSRAQSPTLGASEVIGLYHASFTPSHGNYWAAARTYEDQASKDLGTGLGPNPFNRFSSTYPSNLAIPTCGTGVFCQIGMDGAEVAMGHAMRFVGAPIGILAVATPSVTTSVALTGDATSQTMSVSQTGTIDATWYVAAPSSFQANGGTSAVICAQDPAPPTCPAEQTAWALAVFTQWTGGSLPSSPTQVTSQPVVISTLASTSVASALDASPTAFAYFAQTIAANAGFAQTTGQGQAASSVLAALETQSSPLNYTCSAQNTAAGQCFGTLTANPTAGLSGATKGSSPSGLLDAGTVSASNPGFSATGSALSSAATAAGSGAATAITVGSTSASPATQQISTALITQEAALLITPSIDTGFVNGLSAVKAYTFGTCDPTQTTTACTKASGNPGTLPRTDAYTEVDMRLVYRDTPSN